MLFYERAPKEKRDEDKEILINVESDDVEEITNLKVELSKDLADVSHVMVQFSCI